jgi:uncharacterized membrane protein
MDVGILKYKRTRRADRVLNDVLASQARQIPWVQEIAVVRRPLLGRISIRARLGGYAPGGENGEVREGDLAKKAAELGGLTGYLVGSLCGRLHAYVKKHKAKVLVASVAEKIEEKLLHIDDIKRVLRRGSSALVFMGSSANVDQMLELFAASQAEVIRRSVGDELIQALEELERQTAAAA